MEKFLRHPADDTHDIGESWHIGRENNPWCEKYQPISFSEIIGNEETISRLRAFIASDVGTVPSLMLYGPPGIGKSATICCLIKELQSYKHADADIDRTQSLYVSKNDVVSREREQLRSGRPRQRPLAKENLISTGCCLVESTSSRAWPEDNLSSRISSDVLEVSANENRGVDVIRGKVNEFLSKKSESRKLLIVHEIDFLTTAAQYSLKHAIDGNTNTIFILCCSQIDDVLQEITSRCVMMKFSKISYENIMKRLNHIAAKEKIQYTSAGLREISLHCESDVRRAINMLQFASNQNKVTAKSIVSFYGHSIGQLVENLMILILRERWTANDVNQIVNWVRKLEKGGYTLAELCGCCSEVLKTHSKMLTSKITIILEALYRQHRSAILSKKPLDFVHCMSLVHDIHQCCQSATQTSIYKGIAPVSEKNDLDREV